MSDVPRTPPAQTGQDGEEPELEDLDIGNEDGEIEPDDGGDEAEPEADEEEPEGQAQQVARPTRGQRRQAVVTRENAELRERLARLEGERSRPQPQPQYDPQAQQRADAEFYASLEQMAPVDAMKAVEARANQRFGGAMQFQMLQLRNDADRDRFADSAAQDRNRARLMSRVEELAGNVLASGNLPNRTMIYRMLLGEEMETKAARVLPAARRQASARIAAQTTRPQGGRGDVARGGRTRDQDAEDEALLKGITIGDL